MCDVLIKDVISVSVTNSPFLLFQQDTRDETKMGLADSTSKYESVRNIDARQLNFKYVFMAILVLVISVFAASLFQNLGSGF